MDLQSKNAVQEISLGQHMNKERRRIHLDYCDSVNKLGLIGNRHRKRMNTPFLTSFVKSFSYESRSHFLPNYKFGFVVFTI